LAEGKTVPMLTGTADISHQLPLTMGDYELLEVLGEGGMGIVFKAVQTKLNRTVALKMLRSGLLASKEELKRFHTEAKAVARLKHPNVVTVHEIGEHNGRLFWKA
jgi:serine/threonine protein kinase